MIKKALIAAAVFAALFCFPLVASYVYVNSTYHRNRMECLNCGDSAVSAKEKHRWVYKKCTRKATPKRYGIKKYKCRDCGRYKNVYFSWKYHRDYCVDYDIIKHSNIYQRSSSVYVKLKNPLKGAVIKIYVGDKTYTKKITNNYMEQYVKIKLPKNYYGKGFTIRSYYNGKLIGRDYCYSDYTYDYVFYAENIKSGMTKAMVRNLYYWGSPDDTASASGGWSYWYYDDGSSIDFKNGKVEYWYNATR